MHRRLRGVLGMMAAWSIAWSVACLALAAVQWPLYRARGTTDAMLVASLLRVLPVWAQVGAAGGLCFAIVLLRAGRRPTSIQALSVQQAAAWGAGTGLGLFALRLLALPALAVPLWGVLLIVGCGAALGAATGAGLLALAKRRAEELPPTSRPLGLAPPDA